MARVILDASHGGSDPGDIYHGRMEKDDTLRLALRVGEFLEEEGITPFYTRTTDTTKSQVERVALANTVGGDLLVSLHRLYGENFSIGQSLDFYVPKEVGPSYDAAAMLGESMAVAGYPTYGIYVRTNIPILSNTEMPALSMGIGYMRSEEENKHFDEHFDEIAKAIASGISEYLRTSQEAGEVQMESKIVYHSIANEVNNQNYRYHIQVGLFREYNHAIELQLQLLRNCYQSEIARQGEFFAVRIGDFSDLDEGVELERRLRQRGYDTLLVAI